MGLFTRNFDNDVEQATLETNDSEDWGKIMDVCDKVGNNPQNAKDCLSSIINRLHHKNPHVALQAATLLGACVNNCGKTFHLVVASRDFENEYTKLLPKVNPRVNERLRQLLRTWAEGEFSKDPELILIPSLYKKLKQDGFDFPLPETAKSPKTIPIPEDPNIAGSQKEVDDIAKAIALSLKDVGPSKSPPKSKAGTSESSLYPTTSISSTPEGRKVRALYDFEAAEDNELTFKAGEIIILIDESDPNWWKGRNKRGEGLFPSSFVTADLSVEPEQTKMENKKTVQFNDSVKVKKIKDPAEVVIDESKMDRLLHYLHEADPRDSSGDPQEMRELAEEVNAMGPLIDAALEQVDRKHAQLTQLSSDLVEALNLYHSLMREPSGPGPSYIQKPSTYGYMIPQLPPQPIPTSQFNGAPVTNPPYVPQSFPIIPPGVPQIPNGPPIGRYMPDQTGTHPVNGVPPYGHPVVGPPPQQPPPQNQQYHHMQPVQMPPPGTSSSAPNTHPSNYHDKPPLL
ncbi:UNVERIFIED_CONTAM: hypothetical protein PYX00_006601 [Menopon gallinae]|uniref:Signal transducing adapter molecule 1 n=1 Tax=Menopon gallinae TaxID=328185 RepID=A0AAW2HVX5_9NEOP